MRLHTVEYGICIITYQYMNTCLVHTSTCTCLHIYRAQYYGTYPVLGHLHLYISTEVLGYLYQYVPIYLYQYGPLQLFEIPIRTITTFHWALSPLLCCTSSSLSCIVSTLPNGAFRHRQSIHFRAHI